MAHPKVLVSKAADITVKKFRGLDLEMRRELKRRPELSKAIREEYATKKSWAIIHAIEEAGGNQLDRTLVTAISLEMLRRKALRAKVLRWKGEQLDRELKQIAPAVRPAPTESEQTRWRAMDARRMGEKEE